MPPVKRLNQKTRARSSDNVRAIEMRKERSRDAARNRRGKENSQFDELAKLLPLSPTVTSGLDKASIIKLTIAYLTMQEFSGIGPKQLPRLSHDSANSEADSPLAEGADSPMSHLDTSAMSPASDAILPSNSSSVCETWELETSQHLLEALSGFLLVLNSEGKILYVSESVSTYLGLSQVELTGSSLFSYIFEEDKEDVQAVLNKIPTGEIASTREGSDAFVTGAPIPPFFGQQSSCSSPKPQADETQPESFLTRMKCTLVRRGGSYSKAQGYRVIHFTGRLKEYKGEFGPRPRKAALIAVGQPLPTTNINELTLERDMFVSRVNMDLKIIYCEGRIHRFMDYVAKDIVGMSAYDFYHGGDVALIQNHHAKFLNKGQVWTKYYRWMNKNGGWVWMQTKASLIPHPKNPELKQMLCLNYIVSQVEHRGVVLGMAQMDHKPALGQFVSEVQNDNEDPMYNDAQIEDQVMPFPQWNQNSDNLIPQPTLLESVALNRSGYNPPPLENEVFAPWVSSSGSADADNMDSIEEDLDFLDLHLFQGDTTDITDVDRVLANYVYNGDADSVKIQPGFGIMPSSSSTTVVDDGSFGRAKLEATSPTAVSSGSCLGSSLMLGAVSKQENLSARLPFGGSASCRFGPPGRSASNVQIDASAAGINGLGSWGGVTRVGAGAQRFPRSADNAADDRLIVDLVDELEEELNQRSVMAPAVQQPQQQQQQQHNSLNRTASLPPRLSCTTGNLLTPFPPEVKQEVVTPTSPEPSLPFQDNFSSMEQQRQHPMACFSPAEPAFTNATMLPPRPMAHAPNRNGVSRCGSLPLPNQSTTSRGDANMNHLGAPANGGFTNPVNSVNPGWEGKVGWQASEQSIRSLLTNATDTLPNIMAVPLQHLQQNPQLHNGGADARLCSRNPPARQNSQNMMYQYGHQQ